MDKIKRACSSSRTDKQTRKETSTIIISKKPLNINTFLVYSLYFITYTLLLLQGALIMIDIFPEDCSLCGKEFSVKAEETEKDYCKNCSKIIKKLEQRIKLRNSLVKYL